ncbi:MAG: hypothetical protein COA44_12210 [Arcobacter sp.]|nr:MAG: hypothetical protein COA44_12210 [Arcobacter sp.]
MLESILAWSLLINISVLLFWFLMFIVAHDSLYVLHCRWFKLSVERFDFSHYISMAFYKLLILFFNLAPYLAIRIIS